MELIRDLIEWLANDTGSTLATLFPFMALGLLGLWVLWLVVGYLRVSQVGLTDGGPAGEAIPIAPPADGSTSVDHPRGRPYCAFDGIAYPVGARFCTSCERDLLLDCVTCGATVSAADASCYRCGTPTDAAAAATPALPG